MKLSPISFRLTSAKAIFLSLLTICACFSTPEKKTESAQELIKEGFEINKKVLIPKLDGSADEIVDSFHEYNQKPF